MLQGKQVQSGGDDDDSEPDEGYEPPFYAPPNDPFYLGIFDENSDGE